MFPVFIYVVLYFSRSDYSFLQTFSGNIPEELGELEFLTNIYLHENKLAGTLPASFHKLTQLGSLRLYQNDLTGDISEEMCNLKTHFGLGYIAADCIDEVECSCCDKCY